MAETPEGAAPVFEKERLSLDWLIRPKPSAFLLVFKDRGEESLSELAKLSGMSYVHAIEMTKKLESEGLVSTESRGKKKIVKITEKGSKLLSALEELFGVFKVEEA